LSRNANNASRSVASNWAGTETADVSMGYYDVAIQTGKRVADNCIKHLSA
jgi:hypothetical protein